MSPVQAGPPERVSAAHHTRLIAMGSAALMDNFALIGFETHADAEPEDVEGLLDRLTRERTRALLVLEQALAREPGPALARARNEDPHLVIVEIPPLQAPDEFRPEVEELVRLVLGPGALEAPE
jgi:vacuolar-type H+-ATPase subunit F/Vma7